MSSKSPQKKNVTWENIANTPDDKKTKKDWMTYSRKDLGLTCEKYNLDVNGLKAEFAERLVLHFLGNNESSTTEEDTSNRSTGGTSSNHALVDQVKEALDHMRTELDNRFSNLESTQRESNAETKALRSEVHHLKRKLTTDDESTANANKRPRIDSHAPASSVNQSESDQNNSGINPLINSIDLTEKSHPIAIKNPFKLPVLKKEFLKLIENDEYVDFDKMIPKKLNEKSRENAEGFNVSMHITTNGELNCTRKSTRKIKTYLQWMEVWNLFVQAKLHYQPDMAYELLAYQKIITVMATKYHFPAVYDYDVDIRTLIAAEKSADPEDRTACWTKIHQMLKHEDLDLYQKNTKITCFKCDEIGHAASNCPNDAPPDNGRSMDNLVSGSRSSNNNSTTPLQRSQQINSNNSRNRSNSNDNVGNSNSARSTVRYCVKW